MKQSVKRLLSMALVLVMVLSMLPATAMAVSGTETAASAAVSTAAATPAAASAAVSTASATDGTTLTNEFGFEITVPDGFDSDTTHPYGNGATTVNISPVKEIGVFESASNVWHSRVYNFTESTMLGTNKNTNLFSSSSYYWQVESNFHPSTAMTTQVMGPSSPLETASGTSLDPGGDGRDNLVAYYGRNRSSGQLELYIYRADKNGNHDTVTGAAWTGSSASSYSWMSETTKYNNEGYLSIVSGDFDGDGEDTIILYDPAAGNLQLREFKVTDEINGRVSQVVSYALGSRSWLKDRLGMTPNAIQTMSGNTAKARNTAMVQLAVGDVDRDYKDELIVTLSLSNMLDENGKITNRSSVLMVLDKNEKDQYFTCNWVQQLKDVYDKDKTSPCSGTEGWLMRAASSAVGDIDGDGFPEILTVGVGSDDNADDDNFWADGYFAVITEFTGKPGESGKYSIATTTNSTGETVLKGYLIPEQTSGKNKDFVGQDSDDVNCMSPVSLGLVRLDGTGTIPYAVIRGLIYRYQDGDFAAAKTSTNSLDLMFKNRKIIRQPIVGNFDGNPNGREQIFFAISDGNDNNVEIGGWYYDGSGSVMEGTGLRSCRWETAVKSIPEVVLTAPDADTNDGYIASYQGKEYSCVDPEIMAILEAAPYFEDLKDEYRETLGGTTFGTGKGSGSGSSVQGATRAGAYVSYEQDISIFGIKIGSVEAEVASMLEWSWGVEKATEYEYVMEFDGGRDANQVVLICTPVTIYHYDVYDVATGDWKPMDITLADQPVYTMLSVEEYNAIAELLNDSSSSGSSGKYPIIGSDILSSVPGQPNTYRTSTSGLKNVYTANQLMDVGHGSSTVTQSITKTSSSTFSNELMHSIDVKAGVGAGGFVVGAQGGVSIGGGWSTTDTSSLTRSGTVGQVPDGYDDYSFKWKFITWDATIGTGDRQYTVPVLGYLVTGVKQPPSMPQNVEADPGTDSVTLTWESGYNSAAYYEVCRYVPDDPTGRYYYVRGTVNGSEAVDGVYTFTDTGLESGTQYQYTLRAVGKESTGALLYSNYTESLAVVTASTAGTPRIVSQTAGEVSVLPGATATFEVIATPAISSNSLTFQWQSRGAGESAWKNLTNQEKYKLTVTGTAALDGTSYRCMVAELTSGSIPVFIYSEPVTLKVGKASSTVELVSLYGSTGSGNYRTPTTSGSADHSVATDGDPLLQTVVNRYEIIVGTSDTATVYEAYTAGDTYVYRNVDNSKYYQLNDLSELTLKSGETSVYTGTAASDTELTDLAGYLMDSDNTIISNINNLHGTVQETATFGDATYNVFTAAGVAVQETDSNLQQSTLTLYQKADGSDAGYYVAFYETVDGVQELKLHTPALTAIQGSSYTEENITNFTYLSDTLQASWTTGTQTITVDGAEKDCEVYTDGSVTVHKYTEYSEPIQVPVYGENDEQIGTIEVPVVISETYYYGTTTTDEGEGGTATTTTTYSALTLCAQGLYGVIGSGSTVSGTVTPSAVVTTTNSVPTTVMTQVSGDPVILQVKISAPDASTSGSVTFQITNTTTGVATTRTATVSNGIAEVSWTPATEGVYTIRAVYGGSSTAMSAASNTITYYATAGSDTLYDIQLPAAPQYGDTVTPTLVKWTKTNSQTETVTGASFTYHKYLGTGAAGTDNRGYETTGTAIPAGGISSLQPGAYLIKTTVGSSTITKALTVSKRAINVTLPNFTVSTENASSIDWAEQLKTITVTNPDGTLCTLDADYGTSADGYSKLFTLASNRLTATAGNYDVSVGYKSTAIQSDFLSKYTPTFNRCVATVTTSSYTVTYTAGANGKLTANNITAGSQGFNTGATIQKNSKLLFIAEPDDGFLVSKWTVKNAMTGAELTAGFTAGANSLTLDALSCDLDVTVEFSNETHKVTFGSADAGTGTVTATQFGTTLVSGNPVVGGSSVTFTATPASGYVVKQWSVAKSNGTPVVQLNPDGTTAYTGTTLTLDNIDADTAVTVTFELAGDPFQVTYSAVKNENGSLVPANDVVTFTVDGLINGTAVKGSTVKLTVAVTPGTAIQEWQVSTDGTTWTTVAGSVKEYIIYSLQADTQIRLLVTTSSATYPVTFSIVDGTGAAVSGAGTLTAAYNDGNIDSGASCMAYTTVVFTYTESENYELVSWDVTGTTGTAASSGKTHTYTIDSLDAATEVNVVVQKKPQITFTQPANGTITVTGTIEGAADQTIESGKWVDCGTDITVTVTPTANYVVTGIEAKTSSGSVAASNTSNAGTKASGAQTLTFTPTENVTISATFEEKPTVTIGSGITNGTVTFTGTKNGQTVTEASADKHVDFGSTVTITATPTGGNTSAYVVESINGDSTVNTAKSNGSKTKENVAVPDGGLTVTASFLAKPVVSIGTVTGGTVEVKGTKDGTADAAITNGSYVDFGSSLAVTLTPDTGYEVSSPDSIWTAVANSDDYTYTISNVQENETITPTWSKIPTCVVSYSVVDKNGEEAGGLNGTLTASVDRKGMSVYAVTDDNDRTETVYRDSVITFTATPDSGYKIGKWIVNGTEQSTAPTLTITGNAPDDQTVQVQFDPVGEAVTYGFDPDGETDKASLSAVYQANGSTKQESFPSGNKPTANGVITITVSDLADGYEVEGWYVNGVKQDGETDLTYAYSVTANVGADVLVRIVRSSYTVTFSAVNGSVTAKANGTSISSGDSVVGDTSVTFTAAPAGATGYTFAGWTVDGEPSEEPTESLTLTITEDTVVKASYTLNEVRYTVTYGVIGENGGTLTATALDAENTAAAGSNVVFTATPADGYRVKGWYSDADGTAAIPGTTFEQNTYTLENLLANASVYVAFEPIPTYDITVTVTGLGTVTATVNGVAAEIPANGILAVTRYDDVVLTATPDAYQYLTGWTLDGADQGNGSMTLTLTDVTDDHTVTADFAASQLVEFRTVCGENGSLTAKAGYGETLSSINASTGIPLEMGKKVVLTADPDEDYMLARWTVNGTEVTRDNMAQLGVTLGHYLSNTLTVENLSTAMTIQVSFETYTGFTIPTGDTGYSVDSVTRDPDDTTPDTQIRKNGDVTFTVTPAGNKYLAAITVNGTSVWPEFTESDDSENKLSVQNNGDGTLTITVGNVTQAIVLNVETMEFQTVQNALTEVPDELRSIYGTDVNALQTALRTEVTRADYKVSANQMAFFDIKLQYRTDAGTWQDADPDHFPAGGITVSIPYSELGNTDSSYDFTVIHMFTTNMNDHTIGGTERITPTKDETGISFTVTSLSPFAIGWSKYTAPSGGGGIMPTETVMIEDSINGKVTADDTYAGEGDLVTLTVEPDKGYTLETLIVTDNNGNELELRNEGDGKYTFTMPASKVTVKATFMEDNSMLNFFVDVPADAYYYDAVLWAAKEGITSGTDETHFSPNANCTRAQAVTFLWRAAGSPAPKSSEMPFTDVAEGSYYHDAVLWAVENGITLGTSDTTFTPDAKCTRAQIVTFLWRAAGSPAPKSSEMPFTDVAEGSYYHDAVLWAVENGITMGTSDTTFFPNASCTRAQIVTFLWRAAGSPSPMSSENPLADAAADAYSANAVLRAAENGITGGTAATAFSLSNDCTRTQIVPFLYRCTK